MSVKGVLVWDDAVVLLRNERGEWELPGGRLEPDETPEECVAREIAEELGVHAVVDRLLDVWVYDVLPDRKVLVVTYGCGAVRPERLTISAEHDEARAVPIDAIDDLTIPEGYRRSIRAWRAVGRSAGR